MTTRNGGRRRWIGILGIASILMVIWGWYQLGNVGLGEVGSRLALSLRAACNQHDSERIKRLGEDLLVIENNAAMSKVEIRSLLGIVDKAKRGKWDIAERDARALLESQTRESDQLPNLE